MRKSVRCRAVQRHFGPDPNANNHEPQLVIEAIGQHPAQIIFNFCKENRKQRHYSTDVDQDLGPRKTACQRIYRQFGGKGRKDDRARDRGRGITVLKPVVQQRKGTFHPERDKNEPCAQASKRHGLKGDRLGFAVQKRCARKQDHTRRNLDDQIAHSSVIGPFGAPRPD